MPDPNWATPSDASIRDSCSSRTWPPSRAQSVDRTVGPSQAPTRSRLAAAAGHRERHAPDVARRRRVGRVVVAVGVEPGHRQPPPGPGGLDPGERAGVARAVAADDEQASRRRRRSRQRRRDHAPSRAAGTRAIRARFFARGSGSSRKPGAIARSPASRRLVPASPGRARDPIEQPELAQPGRRQVHAAEMAAEGRRHADEDDVSRHRVEDRRRRRCRSGMMPRCDSPTSRWSATSPAGSSAVAPPAVRLGRRGLADGRPAGAGRRRDRGRCGTASASATPNRPAIRCCAPRSPRCTSTIEPDEVLVFAGAEEAIFCLANVLARAGRPRRSSPGRATRACTRSRARRAPT